MFSVDFEKPLPDKVHARGYVMAYRSDIPFGEMPKLFFEFSKTAHIVYNHGQRLADDVIKVILSQTHREVRLPLELLNYPERILVTAQTNRKGVPLDNTPWLFLDLFGEKSL